MNAVQKTSIAKAIAAAELKRLRKELSVGTHEVDLTVHIHGTLTVGEDETYIPTAELPPIGLLIVALRKAGFMRKAIAELIVETAAEAAKGGDSFRKIVEANNEWAGEMMDEIREQITRKLPEKTRNGKVKSSLILEMV